MRLHPLHVSAMALSASSAALWAVTIDGAWPAGALSDARAGAEVTTVVAAMCWLTRGHRRRQEREQRREHVHLDTIEMLTRSRGRARATPTGPLRRLP